MADPNDRVPVPDPSTLTTEQLDKAIDNLRVLVFERIDRNSNVCDEKFASVRTTLNLIEHQRVEQKQDTKAAVDAALAAAKEAVKEQTTASERAIEKSETATIKSIDQLGDKFDTAFEGQRRDVDDLKERVTTVEQQKVGGREVRDRQSVTVGQVIAAVAVGVALLGLVAAAVIAAVA